VLLATINHRLMSISGIKAMEFLQIATGQ